jgi:hypothetical protein
MSREHVDALEKIPLVDTREGDALATRLAAVERAYLELLGRVQRYERERADIRARLERVLAHIATLKP